MFKICIFLRGKDLKTIRVICYRDRVRSGVREITHSIVVEFDSISFQKGTSYLKEFAVSSSLANVNIS